MQWSWKILCVLLCTTSAASAQPLRPFTGRELYQACSAVVASWERVALQGAHSLLAPDGSRECVLGAVHILMEQRVAYDLGTGDRSASHPSPFCLPSSLNVSVENVRPLVEAYLQQYRENQLMYADMSGASAFLNAMQRQWPCGERG